MSRKNNGVIIENWFDQVKLNVGGEHDYEVEVNDLAQGDYTLQFLSGYETVRMTITVHRGQEWDESFILKRTCLQENLANVNIVKIKSASITPTENGKSKVTVQLKDFSKEVRVHAFAT